MAEYIDRSDVFNPQTPLALKDTVWSVLTVDSLNRLKVVPTRAENIYKNATLNNLYISVNAANHGWTERINYTVPPDKIGILQTIHVRTTIPSAGAVLAILVTVNNVDIVAYINENQSASMNRTLHIPFQYILPPNTNIVAKTYSTDTTTRNFIIAIHIVLFPIEV
jgi:hypothetical protein